MSFSCIDLSNESKSSHFLPPSSGDRDFFFVAPSMIVILLSCVSDCEQHHHETEGDETHEERKEGRIREREE